MMQTWSEANETIIFGSFLLLLKKMTFWALLGDLDDLFDR